MQHEHSEKLQLELRTRTTLPYAIKWGRKVPHNTPMAHGACVCVCVYVCVCICVQHTQNNYSEDEDEDAQAQGGIRNAASAGVY